MQTQFCAHYEFLHSTVQLTKANVFAHGGGLTSYVRVTECSLTVTELSGIYTAGKGYSKLPHCERFILQL